MLDNLLKISNKVKGLLFFTILKIMVQLHWECSELEDQLLPLLHNLYYGAKHIVLFSQKLFHIRV